MTKNNLIRLVLSLSGAEKRQFLLYCKRQSGKQDYLGLFKIIEQYASPDSELIEEAFRKSYPGKSFENTVQYLLKTLTNVLVRSRAGNDKWFQQHFALMRAKLLFDRSLPEEGYRELEKVLKISAEIEDHLMHYIACRQELNHFSETGFSRLSDKELIQLQMRAKASLRHSRQIQEHYSLYELLKYRLVHSGESLSDEDKKKLNDLMISELSLITRGDQHNFESQKLHLLFQSFFFTHIGDYKSALRIFGRLNLLFEENRATWDSPPYDYLASLEGILDSLRTIRYYDEMDYFIEKVEQLACGYTEHFQLIARQVAAACRLNVLICRQELNKAMDLFRTMDPALLKKPGIAGDERLAALFFYVGLLFFSAGKLKQANKYIGSIMETTNFNTSLYKASRLLYLLIHYELDNLEFLEYEIRSYKRKNRQKSRLLNIEQLIFKVIKFDPKRCSIVRKRLFRKKLEPMLENLEHDKYERQVLKYYDFGAFLRSRLQPD